LRKFAFAVAEHHRHRAQIGLGIGHDDVDVAIFIYIRRGQRIGARPAGKTDLAADENPPRPSPSITAISLSALLAVMMSSFLSC